MSEFLRKIWLPLVMFIITFLYWHYTKTFNYWKKKGVFYFEPIIFFGNIKDRILFRKAFHQFWLDTYKSMKGHKFAGFYEGRRATLVVLDPDIIKSVLIRDFSHFMDRPTLQLRYPLIQRQLLNLKGQEWKKVRSMLTPAFTSGKLKAMEVLLQQCGKQVKQYLNKVTDGNDGATLEMKEFYGHFTMDVIATAAFGVQTDSLQNPDSEFVKFASRFNDFSRFERFMIFFVLIFIPQFAKYLPITFFNMEVMNFLASVVRDTIQHREIRNEKRNDFLQLMLDVNEESKAKEKIGEGDGNSHSVMDETTIIAQSVLFLVAGFETSSTLLTFASYELALNKEIQERLREEIRLTLEKHGETNMYEAIQDMPYLDMVLNEALRKHPPLARIDRSCTDDYTIPGTSITIEKGINVTIPVLGIHYDPEYYPEPDKFIPERFSPDEKSKRSPYLFLPFGAGPRNCIGLRFAMLSTKIAMIYLLKDFEINTCEKTQIPYNYSKFSMLLKAEKGIWLKIKPL
nr:PREDICTED: cytochrome P450 9e2-like [Bemisia tabaci]